MKRRRSVQDSRGGCFEFHVFLLGIWWEEDRKWSSVEVNGLLTRQDRRPAMCVCVRASCQLDKCLFLMWFICVTITAGRSHRLRSN